MFIMTQSKWQMYMMVSTVWFAGITIIALSLGHEGVKQVGERFFAFAWAISALNMLGGIVLTLMRKK
jgi:hypothetical protein